MKNPTASKVAMDPSLSKTFQMAHGQNPETAIEIF